VHGVPWLAHHQAAVTPLSPLADRLTSAAFFMSTLDPKPKNLGGRPPIDGTSRESWIQFRTTGERKGAYVRISHGRGMKLSEWITEQLDKAAGYTPSTGKVDS